MNEYMLLGLLLCLLTTLPLAWKWQLGVLRVGGVVLALSTLSGLIVAPLGGWAKLDHWQQVFLIWLLTMASAAAMYSIRHLLSIAALNPTRLAEVSHG